MIETTEVSPTNIRRLLNSARWALIITWHYNRRLLLIISTVTLLLSLVPAGLALTVRGLVNAVADVVNGRTDDSTLLLIWLGISFGLALLETVGSYTNDYFNQRLQDELNIDITGMILTHAARLDVSQFEDPAFQDILERAQQGAARRFSTFVNKTLRVATSVLQMVSLAIILMTIEPWVGLVLIIVAIPYLLFQWRLAKARYTMAFHRVTKQRWTNYFVSRLTNNQWIPEIKLLGIAPHLVDRFREIMVEFRDQNKQIYGRLFAGSALFASLSSIAFYATFVRVVLRVVDGGLTIGDVAVYGGAMARMRSALEAAVISTTEALENSLHIANLRTFLETEPLIRENGTVTAVDQPRGEVTIQDLLFTYPGASQPTLKGINLHIQPGETVALVGQNGAGKTTLVKLIARLYEADEGDIQFDGVGLADWSLNALHQQIGFVFQQFGRYEATVAENIAYGNWAALAANPNGIEAVARDAKIDSMVDKMPNGYETFLGRMFGEYNLSGGQWQRIAVARAFAREASLLILDEPTSNMDAQAEYRLFSRFKELAQGRTTILISHRFSTVSIADRILVMEDGRIVENGTHHELLALGGEYAAMYQAHSKQLEMKSG